MNPSRLDLDDALRTILADTRPVTAFEQVDITAARNRVLHEAADAPVSLPPFPASAMDGYALRAAELSGEPPYRFPVSATAYAGHPLQDPVPEGSCVRIFTGAPVPAELDTVVIQENCTPDGGDVIVNVPARRGDHVRPVGHDVAAGTRILEAGRRLTEFDVGWLAACGLARVNVRQRPVVGIFSTGDELLEAGEAAAPGRIFDDNRLTIGLLLGALPVRVRDFGIVPDDRDEIRRVLEAADGECQMIVTSGGVSVGDADWVREVVEELGHLRLWRLNLKPGKPVAYGRLSRAAFFGLPGNPVSAIVTALLLARPVLERLCGAEPSVPLSVPAVLRGTLAHQPGREEFQRGTLRMSSRGLEVTVTGDQSSNRLGSFAQANCLIRISASSGDLADGSTVTALPFWGLLSAPGPERIARR